MPHQLILENHIWGNLNLTWSVSHMWLQNQLSPVSFEMKDMFLDVTVLYIVLFDPVDMKTCGVSYLFHFADGVIVLKGFSEVLIPAHIG